MDCAENMDVPTSPGDSPRKLTYDTLENPQTQLWLLSIEPGEWSAPLKATLQTLDSAEIGKTPYAAISYTWGDPTAVQPIHINGSEVNVTFNCYYALVQARYHKSRNLRVPLISRGRFVQARSHKSQNPRDPLVNRGRFVDIRPLHLWIDSICINQDDIAEKSAQVARMGVIFREAEAVFCCVGAHDGDSGWLCQQLEMIQMSCRDNYVGLQDFMEKWPPFEQTMMNFDATLDRFAAAYNHFCDRPYWSRLWTLQEVVVGRLRQIWCDTAIIELELLILVGLWYKPSRLGAPGPALQQQIATLDDWIEMDGHKRNPGPVTRFLTMLSSRKCSDPRDLFYGSLSMSQLLLTPDYNKLPCEVALDAIHKFLDWDMNSMGNSDIHDSPYEPHDSVSGVLKRMGITAGDKTFAKKIQERSKHDERPERTAGKWYMHDPTIHKLVLNISSQLLLDDTLRSSQSFSAENGTIVNPNFTNTGTQSIFAGDGTWLGVTSRFTRSGDLLIRMGSFESHELQMERHLVLRPWDGSLYQCCVIGQAATLPLIVPSGSTAHIEYGGYVGISLDPEDLIVYCVQSLIPPEWNDIDWILSCVATRFYGPTT